jgi:hypothetical protein
MFTVDANYQVQQPVAQFFASQMINQEWIKSPAAEYRVFPAKGDLTDGAGHALITAYGLQHSDGEWSLMLVNRDQFTGHKVRIAFHDDAAQRVTWFGGAVAISSFGREQYQWHPATTTFMAHGAVAAQMPVIANTKGYADPDGPIVRTTKDGSAGTEYDVPAAAIVVLRGKLAEVRKH